MGIEDIHKLLGTDYRPPKPKSRKRDKSLNTPAFNKMAKARREKAKKNAQARKRNR